MAVWFGESDWSGSLCVTVTRMWPYRMRSGSVRVTRADQDQESDCEGCRVDDVLVVSSADPPCGGSGRCASTQAEGACSIGSSEEMVEYGEVRRCSNDEHNG